MEWEEAKKIIQHTIQIKAMQTGIGNEKIEALKTCLERAENNTVDFVVENLRNHIHDLQYQSTRLMEENEELKHFKESFEDKFKFIMDEECDSVERHCTCVPFLREKINELQKIKEHRE